MDIRETLKRNDVIRHRHPWELARFTVVMKMLRRSGLIDKPCTILDLGCGDTFFVENMAAMLPGFSFWAVDPAFDDSMLNDARERLRSSSITIFNSIEELNHEEHGRASLVIMLDVLEHVDQDVALLADLRNRDLLEPQASLLVTVPAFESLMCSHDVFLGHYRRYDNALLADRVRRGGWNISNAGYFFTSLLVPRLFQTVAERIKKTPPDDASTGLVEWRGGKLLTSILRAFLILDFEVSWHLQKLGVRLPGLSNFAICHKP